MWSVVIPTCNRPDLLKRCLDCVAPHAQTVPEASYEVIVTDDGKDDISRDLVLEKYPWARWTRGPGRGPAANRNHGVTLARGSWLAFTDDDCLPSAVWLEHFGAASLTADMIEGRTLATRPYERWREEAPVNDSGGLFWTCNLAIKADLFARLGGFCEYLRICEDEEFRERAKTAGVAMAFARDALVLHPPRTRSRGMHRGADWKSRLIYEEIKNSKVLTRWPLPLAIARLHLGEACQAPLSYWPALVRSAVLEALAVALREPGWRREAKRVVKIHELAHSRQSAGL